MGRGHHVPDDTLISAVADLDPPVVTTTEVLDAVPLSNRPHLAGRLGDLKDAGELGGRRIGQAKIWWTPGTTLP